MTAKRDLDLSIGRLFRQLTTFIGVGFVATAVHYAVLIGLVELGGVGAVVAALAGFTAGGVVSYIFNRRHTFGSNAPHQRAIRRFAVVAIGGFGFTFVFMMLFIDFIGMPYLLAQAITTCIVMFWSFAAHRNYTFA
ncbi:GtrA family protein [Methylocapsa palsarum]|uniref:Putative flippase GtrA (Transmembrane translocase of bactoprenol-linked glucose) n=1 Tax=Methylocapsa palsarum TaxID=1612308 RepID=A0A1I3Y0P2_9HYPH|nr:GtrA family protein [Methylocapsa palsarum]SFK25332.1 Putative flippase GtrA (transmembrane translocase of bactoprenol-linked glucose) [Methylocapsa palsarum]